MKHHLISKHRQLQSGAVLIVVLVMLVVLTMLGITGAQQTVLEERMAGNFRDQQIGFEVAEAVLRVAEDIVIDQTTFEAIDDADWKTSGNSADGLYEGEQVLDPLHGGHTRKAVPSARAGSASDPDYYVERLHKIYVQKSSIVRGFPENAPTMRLYRATSRANGKSKNVEVILQSTTYR